MNDDIITHAEAEALLPAYQAGTLERGQMRALHQHFKECETCRTRIRLRRAVATPSRTFEAGLTNPEIQKQVARNRDLLVKILVLMLFGWLVWRLRR